MADNFEGWPNDGPVRLDAGRGSALSHESPEILSPPRRVSALEGGVYDDAKRGVDTNVGNMFADADALRDNIHANIDKRDYDVTDFYYETGIFQWIARSRRFGSATLTTIALNALWIGLDTECNDGDAVEPIENCPVQPSDLMFWKSGEHFFCAFFTFELLVRFGAFRRKRDAFKDHWFKFDTLLVFFMVLETWIVPLSMGGSDGGDALADFALLRMLRLLRLTRMVRLMRSVPELVTLLRGMMLAAKSVSYTLLLLVIFMYIFSIVFKNQLQNSASDGVKEHFGSIPRSMWTLLLAGCFLDDITTIANYLVWESHLMAGVFIIFVLLASLMVLNMLIGVLCAVVTAVAAAEKEKALVSLVKMRLISVLEQLDEDGNGTISQAEFNMLIHIPEAVTALEELGVDVANFASLSDHLFEREEEEDCDGKDSSEPKEVLMTFADFLEMVFCMRADNTLSVANFVELRKLIFKGQRTAAKRFQQMEKGQHALRTEIETMFERLEHAMCTADEMEGRFVEVMGKVNCGIASSDSICSEEFQESIENESRRATEQTSSGSLARCTDRSSPVSSAERRGVPGAGVAETHLPTLDEALQQEGGDLHQPLLQGSSPR